MCLKRISLCRSFREASIYTNVVSSLVSGAPRKPPARTTSLPVPSPIAWTSTWRWRNVRPSYTWTRSKRLLWSASERKICEYRRLRERCGIIVSKPTRCRRSKWKEKSAFCINSLWSGPASSRRNWIRFHWQNAGVRRQSRFGKRSSRGGQSH